MHPYFYTQRKRFIMSVFSHAGVSRLNGEFKVRFANDALRVKVLAKNGHKDIDIIELKEPMSKEDAIAYLMSIDFATQNGVTNAEVEMALFEAVDKRAVKPAKAPKAVKAKPTMESIKAKAVKAAPKSTVSKAEIVAQMEDAPY
jgi:hypothetical protein